MERMNPPNIFLTIDPEVNGADRGLLVGESGTGKSTLAKVIVQHFSKEFLPRGRILIADTKPRWRATKALGGTTPVSTRYRKMVKGDSIDSMVLDKPSDWKLVWDRDLNPSRTVIMQPPTGTYNEDREIRRQVYFINRFFNTLDPSEPSMLYIDEGMDFFGPTGVAKYGSIINRCYRAGRERLLVTLMAVQRPACISQLAMTESNVKYQFMVGNEDAEMIMYKKGFPRLPPVRQKRVFRLIRDSEPYPKLLTLKL